jgi:hypothetical protein
MRSKQWLLPNVLKIERKMMEMGRKEMLKGERTMVF